MYFTNEKLCGIVGEFMEEMALSQVKCTKDICGLLVNLLQTYHFIIADTRYKRLFLVLFLRINFVFRFSFRFVSFRFVFFFFFFVVVVVVVVVLYLEFHWMI
jgi:hypothetical protein